MCRSSCDLAAVYQFEVSFEANLNAITEIQEPAISATHIRLTGVEGYYYYYYYYY